NAAVQLAKRAGARVIATVSSEEKAELARAADADAVVVGYGRADEIRAHAPQGVDRIVEVALTSNLETDLAVLNPRGAIVTYASEPEDPVIPVRRLMSEHVRLDFLLVYQTPRPALERAVVAIARAVRAGAIVELPSQSFPLAEIARAHTVAESGPTG